MFLSHHVKVAFGHQIGDAVIQKPDVKRLLEDSVVFDDDSVEKVNSIIYCTGKWDKTEGSWFFRTYLLPTY